MAKDGLELTANPDSIGLSSSLKADPCEGWSRQGVCADRLIMVDACKKADADSGGCEVRNRLAVGLAGRPGLGRSGVSWRSRFHSLFGTSGAVAARVWSLCLGMILLTQCGCPVPQRPGLGHCSRLVEPQTKTGYWLYLPEDYVRNSGQHANGVPWPLVVTLHGLRPYDDARPQIRSWQEEADRYGLIVVAPELRTCDQLVMQLPLRDPTKWYVKADEKAILAVMDEVCQRTNADPTRVLLTCFSSGGYLAHFMMNRHPARFTTLAAMGANFSEELLDYAQLAKYRGTRMAIFFGENDFKLCREESLKAVEWYRRYRFDVEARQIAGLGHERRPQVASAFFGRLVGVVPKTPPDLASLVMQDVTTQEPSRPLAHPRPTQLTPAPIFPNDVGGLGDRSGRSDSSPQSTSKGPTTVAPMEPPVRTPKPVVNPPPPPTPRRPARQPYSEVPEGFETPSDEAEQAVPGRIRIHGQPQGQAPLWLEMSVEIPAELRDEAGVLWLANGRPIASSGMEARTILRHPGMHHIEAWVTVPGDRRSVYRETVEVLATPDTQPSP